MATDNETKRKGKNNRQKNDNNHQQLMNPKKKKLQNLQQNQNEADGSDLDKLRAKKDNRRNHNGRNKHTVVTDERFASVHYYPRFQRVPKKESKVAIDSRFAKMFSDKNFDSLSVPVDKSGRVKKNEVNSLMRYYHNEEEEGEYQEEEEVEERGSGSEVEVSEEEESSLSDDEDEYDFDDEVDIVQSDIATYLMAGHEDTSLTLTEEETNRLAVVNMDWDHIKAVDLYVTIRVGAEQTKHNNKNTSTQLNTKIYSGSINVIYVFSFACMEVEAVRGPSALINYEEHSEDESDSEDDDVRNEKLRTYELNKLSYYYRVVLFDSIATANHINKNLDGTEVLKTSNVFDLRFIPDSMEFKHPRDTTTEPPTNYTVPDFHTHALQHSKVNMGGR